MKETSKQNLAILAITFLLMSTFFVFMKYTKPQLEELKQTLIAIEESKQKLQIIKNFQNKFQSLLNTYETSRENTDLINYAMPDKSQTAQIVAILNAINQKSGVQMSGINFSEEKKEEYGIVNIDTEIFATYDQLKYWLQEVEKELRLMDLMQITINPLQYVSVAPSNTKNAKANTDINKSLLYCKILLTAYYQI